MHATDRVRGALLPVSAGAAGVAGSFALVGLSERFVGVALATIALDLFPPVVFALGIGLLGSAAKPLLVASATLAVGAAFAALAAVGRRLPVRSPGGALAAFLSLAALTLALTRSPASAAGAGLGGTLAVVAGDVADDGTPFRRRFLRSTGVVLGTVGLGGLLALRRDGSTTAARVESDGPGLDDDRIPRLLEHAADRSFDFPGEDPLVSEGFYRVDINVAGFPDLPPADWSMRIHGAVERDLDVSFADLTSHPTEHRFVTLRCVSDNVNGRLIDTALWTGTPLGPLLDAAGAGRNCCVRLEAADGYYQAFPREALDRGFLAWGMNGEPLPEAHGAPVRALIPGHWGEINVKWISDVEIREEPATGYWEERGWHGTGPVKTVAKFHHRNRDGARVSIGGHAYAGTRGVSRVEVSTDGGETWTDAELTEPLPAATPVGGDFDPESRAADAWRMWRHEYENPDRHEVTVRAYERDGTRQPRAETDPHPSGASGWVTQQVFPADDA